MGGLFKGPFIGHGHLVGDGATYIGGDWGGPLFVGHHLVLGGSPHFWEKRGELANLPSMCKRKRVTSLWARL